MNIYLIDYSTEYEVEAINDDSHQASIKNEATPSFKEVTKDWNNYVKQTIIDKIKDDFHEEKIVEGDWPWSWVEEKWSTVDTKNNRIYGQISRKKIIKCLDNENNEVAMIVVYEIEL